MRAQVRPDDVSRGAKAVDVVFGKESRFEKRIARIYGDPFEDRLGEVAEARHFRSRAQTRSSAR